MAPAQSDTEPAVIKTTGYNMEGDGGPCTGPALAQSDAGPAMPQTLRDAAENLLIAIGMGWDIEGCVENLRAALVQSDTEPQEMWNKQPPGPDSILHELGDYPDASAGLIEAAEMAEQCANGSFSKNEAMYLRGFADRLRARAADRSGK